MRSRRIQKILKIARNFGKMLARVYALMTSNDFFVSKPIWVCLFSKHRDYAIFDFRQIDSNPGILFYLIGIFSFFFKGCQKVLESSLVGRNLDRISVD